MSFVSQLSSSSGFNDPMIHSVSDKRVFGPHFPLPIGRNAAAGGLSTVHRAACRLDQTLIPACQANSVAVGVGLIQLHRLNGG